ncbi:hypothetical protein [Synechococcus sp. PCC 6312]|uniref:hypothetical protein n=1 Tax=Synechococcus sp. (strain ATCC 27167 / PCC 6312) TaxID=195253 RepID=UPI00029ED9DC|nr:hypothetical protein [Synechococcus sp. PCC 6312]AFY60666.1 Tfp pilus assembly protein FimT [Synechococcus sp. PCC 6312]
MTSLLSKRHHAGFSSAEIFVIVAIIAIMAAIGIPSWLGFLSNQRMRVAQSGAVSAIRLAQAGARREKLPWTVAFRTNNNRVQWTANRSTTPVTDWNWTDLTGDSANQIQISTTATNFTLATGTYQYTFEYNGQVSAGNTVPGRITFQPREGNLTASQRCVRVVTLLGAIRLDKGTACSS